MMPAVSHRGRTGWHHWSSGKARVTQSTMGGCWVSNNMPRAPAVLIIKFTRADSSPPKSSNSQDAQDAHQRPQRRGNKEVLDLVLCSRWYLQPLNAADERQSAGDETRTSWEEEMDGDITIWSEKDQKYSLQGPRWPENHNYVGDGEHGGDTAWEQASPAAPTSTTSSSRAGPRRPTTTQRMGSSGSRQTDREWVVGQVDWYDKKPSLPRVYYVLTYRWQNTFSSCNRITKLNFYTILRQIYSLKSKDKLF